VSSSRRREGRHDDDESSIEEEEEEEEGDSQDSTDDLSEYSDSEGSMQVESRTLSQTRTNLGAQST